MKLKRIIISLTAVVSIVLAAVGIGSVTLPAFFSTYPDFAPTAPIVSEATNSSESSAGSSDSSVSSPPPANSDFAMPAGLESYEVLRVVDGDTFKIMYEGKEESVRLIGVDTPESVHPNATKNVLEGKTVSDYSKLMLEGQTVYLELGVNQRDRYGRLLAYVYGNFLNDNKNVMYQYILLWHGYAEAKSYPPDVKYNSIFEDVQKVAKSQNAGYWDNGEFL